MKIVAILQNMWVLPRQVESVSRHEPTSEVRERMIHYSLFAGCLTGRRLKAALPPGVAFIPCVHPACRAPDTALKLAVAKAKLDIIKEKLTPPPPQAAGGA